MRSIRFSASSPPLSFRNRFTAPGLAPPFASAKGGKKWLGQTIGPEDNAVKTPSKIYVIGGLSDRAGRSIGAAEARSLVFAVLRRLRPADRSGGFIAPQPFVGDPLTFGLDGTVLFGGAWSPPAGRATLNRENRARDNQRKQRLSGDSFTQTDRSRGKTYSGAGGGDGERARLATTRGNDDLWGIYSPNGSPFSLADGRQSGVTAAHDTGIRCSQRSGSPARLGQTIGPRSAVPSGPHAKCAGFG